MNHNFIIFPFWLAYELYLLFIKARRNYRFRQEWDKYLAMPDPPKKERPMDIATRELMAAIELAKVSETIPKDDDEEDHFF